MKYERVRVAILNSSIDKLIGNENILSNINDAVKRATFIVEK